MNDRFERRITDRDWPWYVEAAIWEQLVGLPVERPELRFAPRRPSTRPSPGALLARLFRRGRPALAVVPSDPAGKRSEPPIERVA